MLLKIASHWIEIILLKDTYLFLIYLTSIFSKNTIYNIENYILSLDGIHPDLTRMVYQTEGNEFGIPIQIYCFTKTTDWAEYENIQSDIFDHLYAAAPQFGLEVFQHPSGADFNNLAK